VLVLIVVTLAAEENSTWMSEDAIESTEFGAGVAETKARGERVVKLSSVPEIFSAPEVGKSVPAE